MRVIISYDSHLSKYWQGMFPSETRTRSVRPGGKYRSILHTKISVIQTGIFGRMERARQNSSGNLLGLVHDLSVKPPKMLFLLFTMVTVGFILSHLE